MKKKIFALMLVVAVFNLFIVSFTGWSASTTSGDLGNGITWKIDSDNTLTISGNGKMDGNSNCLPWSGVKKVVIKNGVKNISKSLFENSTSLTAVEIGDDVTLIGENAFRKCKNLTSVKMGKSVSEIGDYSFFFCEKLTNIELPDSLKRIGRCAFMCAGLKTVNIPNGVTTIDISAFQACDNLTSVKVPDSVTKLNYGAFCGCSSLTSAKLGKGLTYIDNEIFYDCINLETLEFGKNIKSIFDYAFSGCDKLKNVYYSGSKSDWKAIGIGDDNSCLTTAKINYVENTSQSSDIVKVKLDGKYIKFDVDPQIINDRTMVPIRAIFEAMGANVTWDGNTSTATAVKGTKKVKMTIKSKNMYVNGKTVKLDVAPVVVNGRTLAPARFVAEAFNADVKWDGVNKIVTITTK